MSARARFCNMQCTLAARNAREHGDRWAVKESLDRRCEACAAALPTGQRLVSMGPRIQRNTRRRQRKAQVGGG